MQMYDDLALLADSLLAEFGQPVTIRHTVPGEYDPEIGGASSVTTKYGRVEIVPRGMKP